MVANAIGNTIANFNCFAGQAINLGLAAVVSQCVEMCIRDSAHIGAGRQGIVLLRNLGAACHLAQAGDVPIFTLAELLIEPVSYTHLDQPVHPYS